MLFNRKFTAISITNEEMTESSEFAYVDAIYFHGKVEEHFNDDRLFFSDDSYNEMCFYNQYGDARYPTLTDIFTVQELVVQDKLDFDCFEVKVLGYDRPCICILLTEVSMNLLDKANLLYRPFVRYSGRIVDAEEWESGLDNLINHSCMISHEEITVEGVRNRVKYRSLLALGKEVEAREFMYNCF